MYFHVPTGWSGRSAKQNRVEKGHLVNEGRFHGVLVYEGGEPVGIYSQFSAAVRFSERQLAG